MTTQVIWTESKLLTRELLTVLVGLGFPVAVDGAAVRLVRLRAGPGMGGIGGVDYYVPIHVAATVAAMGFLGVPTHLAAYHERGGLQRFRAAGGEPAATILTGAALISILVLQHEQAVISAETLTALPPERDVAPFVVDGLSDREIAERPCLSHYVVSQYVKRIYRQLDVGRGWR